ncbi:MAG TPA: general secretion pathway protein GspG [Solibacterales bacterium]|nr:general secretion pathway protein GspG [Bryobacterales bacterium]
MVNLVRYRRRGFSLIELMIVMAIIVILIGMAVPYYQKSILRSRETVLRSNLFSMRSMIDEYSFDKQKAPQTLDDLVHEGYLREMPKDPITNSNDTWRLVMEDAGQSVNQTEPGIFDVHSGSDKTGLDGTPYADW